MPDTPDLTLDAAIRRANQYTRKAIEKPDIGGFWDELATFVIKNMKDKATNDQWQPIETAPKDGTLVDLWAVSEHSPEGRRLPDCYWAKGMLTPRDMPERWRGRGMPVNHLNWQPTHWMPYPDPRQ